MHAGLEEQDRRTGDLLRMGVVEGVEGDRCTVAVGDLVTGPIPWFVGRAGKTRRWSAVSPGEQGMLLCPEGEIAAGVFLPGVLSTSFPAPAEGDVEVIRFEDGAELRYDPDAHVLAFTLPGGGILRVVADVEIDGAVTVTETVTAHDAIARGVSLHDHLHTGVKPDVGVSGKPLGAA